VFQGQNNEYHLKVFAWTNENSFLQLGVFGFVDLFKTTSNLYIAGGLIFKGLIGYFSIITKHSDIRQWRKSLKIRPLLNWGAI
jgi:hypothetical protein